MMLRMPEPPLTWLLACVAGFLLLLNVGMLLMLVGNVFVFESIMGFLTLVLGAAWSWRVRPWRFFESKD